MSYSIAVAMAERPTYSPPLPDDLRKAYEDGLASVPRWVSDWLPSKQPENDLEHVNRMLIILEEMPERFPHIADEVDFETTAHMIYIHDGGEILAGDLPHSHPDYNILKPQVKRRERLGFRWITRQITDIELREYTRELYKRAEGKAPGDKEAQLTDLLDKTQAVRFGLTYVYNGRTIKGVRERSMHLNHSVTAFLNPAEMFIRSLTSEDARAEAVEFVKEEFTMFRKSGYSKRDLNPYITRLNTIS